MDARQYAQTIEDHVSQLAKEDGEKVVCLGASEANTSCLFGMRREFAPETVSKDIYLSMQTSSISL